MTGQPPDPEFNESMLLEHADRGWKAEQDFAEKLSARSRTIATMSASLVGLLVIGLGAVFRGLATSDPPAWLRWPVAILTAACAVIAGSFLVRAIICLSVSKRYPERAIKLKQQDEESNPDGKPPTASYGLRLRREVGEWAIENLDPRALLVAKSVFSSADDLRRRNLREKYRVQAAEDQFGKGLWGLLLAASCLVISFGVLFVLGD
ncbi:MAG: hypothetical protein AAFR38_00820 [Planctomycetota bacterium]